MLEAIPSTSFFPDNFVYYPSWSSKIIQAEIDRLEVDFHIKNIRHFAALLLAHSFWGWIDMFLKQRVKENSEPSEDSFTIHYDLQVEQRNRLIIAEKFYSAPCKKFLKNLPISLLIVVFSIAWFQKMGSPQAKVGKSRVFGEESRLLSRSEPFLKANTFKSYERLNDIL